MWFANTYDPFRVGSIDGTATAPHDAAIQRATSAQYTPPKYPRTDPIKTIFAGRLSHDTTESTLRHYFEKYGPVSDLCLIRNSVTGLSKGYAFITYTSTYSAKEAYDHAHRAVIDEHVILVDYERSRVMSGWVPRRLGGGFGGKKESGQLRFGARDRPFRMPIHQHNVTIGEGQRHHDNWRMKGATRGDSSSHSRPGSSGDSSRRHQTSRDQSPTRDRRSRARDRSGDYRFDRPRGRKEDPFRDRERDPGWRRHRERDRYEDQDRSRDRGKRRRTDDDRSGHGRRR